MKSVDFYRLSANHKLHTMKNTLTHLFSFILVASLLFIPQAGQALGNQPPDFLFGQITPEIGHQGKFTALTEWNDPDGDFVVDVTLRYKLAPDSEWEEVVLDYVDGSSPPQFTTELLLLRESGEHQFAFRASDANPADGPRIHTTEWLGDSTFKARVGRVGQPLGCLGTDPSQVVSDVPTTPPDVVFLTPQPVLEGQRTLLTATADIDAASGGVPSFLWCVDLGQLEQHPDFPDYSSVWYQAPMVPGTNRYPRISVKLSDNLGYVDTSSRFIEVQEVGNHEESDPPPSLTISTSPTWQSGQTVRIDFELDDLDLNDNSSAHLLSTDLYLRRLSTGTVVDSVTGIRGAPHKYIWRMKSGLAHVGPFEIRARTTDGNSETVAFSESISVEPTFGIEGFVQLDDGSPLAGTTIALAGLDVLESSDASGYFIFGDLTQGSFTIVPSKDNFSFIPSSTTIVLSDGHPIDRSLVFVGTEIQIPPDMTIDIDIKPGSDDNPINYSSNGKIPVAILSAPDFNAPAEVDLPTLTFGRTGNEESLHYRGNGEPNCSDDEDHNGDGLNDLKCHFHTPIAGFQPGDTEGILRGITFGGEAFEGRDHITIVGPGIFSSSFDSGGFDGWSSVVGGGN